MVFVLHPWEHELMQHSMTGCPHSTETMAPTCFTPVDAQDIDGSRKLSRHSLAFGKYFIMDWIWFQGEPVSEDEVFVAVKTCKKFHKTRVPVVQKTWGKQTKHIRYYSEEADESIPTIDVGVPNAEGGHCAKTYAILVRTVWQSHIDNKKWLVITDDDTLLSVPRLRRLLACYDPTEPIALGERYGYGVNANYGYDYVTSGGGMVFSLLTVRQLLGCRCSTPNSPD
ncbi:Beta-1,3-glucosyltransferase [Lamellibrachia satsuma]|nr:Beta-1,3-glucosyltransferase [Lamellibrachia satsuma]